MTVIATKTEVNACYRAIKQLDEARVLLNRAKVVLDCLGERDMHGGFARIYDLRNEFDGAIQEYLGDRINVPYVESLDGMLDRMRSEQIAHNQYRSKQREREQRDLERNDPEPPPPIRVDDLGVVFKADSDASKFPVLQRCELRDKHLIECSEGETGVKLSGYGDRKINVIRALREHIPLGLKEAKEFVEATPQLEASVVGLSDERARQLVYRLNENGADAWIC